MKLSILRELKRHKGKKNAITRYFLTLRLNNYSYNFSESETRKVRAEILALVKEGFPICYNLKDGYFWGTKADVIDNIAIIDKQIRGLKNRKKALIKIVKEGK